MAHRVSTIVSAPRLLRWVIRHRGHISRSRKIIIMIQIVQPTLHDFDQVMAEFRQAWDSGQVSTGVFTRQFENAVEQKLGVPHAVMVQSCTAGLMLVLRALELEGEAIISAFTWTATGHAVMWNGLSPVFADIVPGTYTLDPQAVKKAITPRTSVLIPVNVFGCPPDYQAFEQIAQQCGLRLVFDSAQGLGSRYQVNGGSWRYSGNFGDAEVFSLSPTKVVSAMEGGLITTRNADLAQKLRQMRDYGKSSNGEDIEWLGLSARVPEINAIVGLHNFSKVDELISKRESLVRVYKDALTHLPGLTFQKVPATYRSSYNYFTLFISPSEARKSRDEVYASLKEQGIQTKKYFYPALHLQKVYQNLGKPYQGKIPVTEAASAAGLALPLYSHMKLETITEVYNAVIDILGGKPPEK
jgi:dTDP-4-amino-4,6-dideoxygalactose transaminase